MIISTIKETHYLMPDEVMSKLGYRNRQAFYEFVRRSGVPFIRLSKRKIVFEEASLQRWFDSRTVGRPSKTVESRERAAAYKIEVDNARSRLANELKTGKERLKSIENEIQKLRHDAFVLGAWAHGDTGYPKPPAPITIAKALPDGVPSCAGIYFVWNGEAIEYVGKSICLFKRLRLGAHHAIKETDAISWIEFQEDAVGYAESFYIGTLRPVRNVVGTDNTKPAEGENHG